MKLYIDTSDNQKTIVGLDQKKLEKPTGPDKSQQVLSLIKQILIHQRRTINQITAIEVNTGPGSFTGLRVGVAVANVLGWVLQVPVNGKRINKSAIIEPHYE